MWKSTIGWVVAFVLAAGGSAFAYVFYFAGGSGEPTVELTTPELTTPSSVVSSNVLSFEIDQARSSARFEIDEVLQGQPQHVVGTTDQVVGVVSFDPADLSTVEFSNILINARTLNTDSDRRNRAIRGPVILDSARDENELITLVVTSIDGLTGAAEVGETLEFDITGDLTIRGTTQSVTFATTALMSDEGTLEGSVLANVLRSDFGIGIPSVPGVADVTDEVVIGLDFVAISG